MSKPNFSPKLPVIEQKLGYLVLRLKEGEGLNIEPGIEIRLCKLSPNQNEATIAIKAPKDQKISKA